MIESLWASAKSGGLVFFFAGLLFAVLTANPEHHGFFWMVFYMALGVFFITLANLFAKKYLGWTTKSFNSWDELFDVASWFFTGVLVTMFII